MVDFTKGKSLWKTNLPFPQDDIIVAEIDRIVHWGNRLARLSTSIVWHAGRFNGDRITIVGYYNLPPTGGRYDAVQKIFQAVLTFLFGCAKSKTFSTGNLMKMPKRWSYFYFYFYFREVCPLGER